MNFDLQRSPDIGLCENVVEGFFKALEHQIELGLGVRQRRRKAEKPPGP